MTITVHDCKQGSPEWLACRSGLATASEFHSILAKGEGKVRRSYLYRLAGERITGEPAETYTNAHMERGKVMEAEARELYAFAEGVEVVSVGFLHDTEKNAGCSPDGLIGEHGILEVKTKLPALLLQAMESGKFPSEHVAQCQGALWVSGRAWVDLTIYWPKMKPVIRRAERDEKYIDTLASEVRAFNEELAAIVARYHGASKSDLSAALTVSVEAARRETPLIMAG